MHGLDLSARVIYIGTFSKVLFPSLRLGYMVIPPDLVTDSLRCVMRWTWFRRTCFKQCWRIF